VPDSAPLVAGPSPGSVPDADLYSVSTHSHATVDYANVQYPAALPPPDTIPPPLTPSFVPPTLSRSNSAYATGTVLTGARPEPHPAWPGVLVPLDDSQALVAEMSQFAEHWRSFYVTLNSLYLYSVPRRTRDLLAEHLRFSCARDDLARASASTWSASHYAALLASGGDPRQAEFADKAARFYHKALELVHDRAYPLVNRLHALLDMRLGQLDHQPAGTANFLLSVGDQFVLEERGTQPRINFGQSVGMLEGILHIFAYADVLRTVAQPGRRTLFALEDDPARAVPAAEPQPVEGDELTSLMLSSDAVLSEAPGVHLGLPRGLLVCLAATTNLACDAPTLAHDQLARRADPILARLAAWTPAPAPPRESSDSSVQRVVEVAEQEAWRQAGFIYAYTALYRMGPLDTPVRSAVRQAVRLAGVLALPDVGEGEVGAVFGARAQAAVWFLVGMVAVTAEEREACRARLRACGEGRVWRGNREVVEAWWSRTGENGVAEGWREACEREGWAVAFM